MIDNFLKKISSGQSVKIGWFGGSITEGGEENSFASYTERYFQSQYPDAKVQTIWAAIGGTGSDLGVFRVDDDLISYHPDLVFYEFAVNDYQKPYADTVKNTESIFRKLYRDNPLVDIIVIYTNTKEVSDNIKKGQIYPSRVAHSMAAYHYGLDQLDFGEVLRDTVHNYNNDWLLFTRDTVHPNARGYAVYNEVLEGFYNDLRADFAARVPAGDISFKAHELPQPISESLRMGAKITDAFEMPHDGWKEVHESMFERYPHYIEAEQPGTELKFEFTGSDIGLYWVMDHDSGCIEYELDGEPTQMVDAWDIYCKEFGRANYAFLGRDLEYGRHRVTLRISEHKSPESDGTAIRVGAWLVN